ncbi:transposase [Rufibacter sediminis]|uniref:Transposase IS200-like domain-containing protein n=1 Tax=Rufibacter sediminis TaxID=2762756 RepID=A0ABR6VQV1_9BACT|nr:hypothetical protein [Rufibacter sediminis]MBC3539228.1 hypothetical protein [Rufibacter sediminis]
MQQTVPLEAGKFYHVYTRGNNKETVFVEERNYEYFLQLYLKYITPFADTFAYCLLRNHFHFLIRVKEVATIQTSQVLKTCEVLPAHMSKQFSNLLNAYTKAINSAYGRTGSLFQERFGRIEVTSPGYFTRLIYYIHFNPQKHGFVEDFRDWPHSSYHSFTSLNKRTNLKREEVLEWFGGVKWYQDFH